MPGTMQRGVFWDECKKDDYYAHLVKHCMRVVLNAEHKCPKASRKIVGITVDPERRWAEYYKKEGFHVMIVLCDAPDRGAAGALEHHIVKELRLDLDNKKPGDDGPRTGKRTYVYFVTSAKLDLQEDETAEGSSSSSSSSSSEGSSSEEKEEKQVAPRLQAKLKRPAAAMIPKSDLDALRRVATHTNPRSVSDADLEVVRIRWIASGISAEDVHERASSITSFVNKTARRPITGKRLANRLLEDLE